MSLANRNSLEPWMPDSIKYYRHQIEGVRRMTEMRSVILADEMGLGKTLQTITVFAVDVKRRAEGRGPQYGDTMLVVCPASLTLNWLEEIRKFSTFHAEILDGAPAKREKQLVKFAERVGPKILIVNYEKLKIHLQEINDIRFHLVAFDEAHRMKNMKSGTSKACLAVVCQRAMAITGSPLLNQVDELYPLLERTVPGEWGSFGMFTQRYCVFGGYGGKQIIGPKNTEELKMRLANLMIRRLKSEVLDLPQVQYVTRIAGMHPRQRALYRQVVEEMRLEASASSDGKEQQIKNALTKFLRLKQICGTTASVVDDDHSEKLDLAADDARLVMSSGQRVVAFTQFRSVLEAYRRRLEHVPHLGERRHSIYVIHGDVPADSDGRDPSDPKKRWSRQEIVHRWANDPQPSILIAMYQVAGVGLNMTAARIGQLLDKLFVPALNQQAVDRMHRIGADATQPVQVMQYICLGTAEDRVEKILSKKQHIFSQVVEQTALEKKLIQELLKEELK